MRLKIGLVLKTTGKTVERTDPGGGDGHGQANRRDDDGTDQGIDGDEDEDDNENENENGSGLHHQPDEPQTMRAFERIASFKDVTVWGHDAVPEDDDDPYIRGMREWVGLAEVVSRKKKEKRERFYRLIRLRISFGVREDCLR